MKFTRWETVLNNKQKFPILKMENNAFSQKEHIQWTVQFSLTIDKIIEEKQFT